MRKARFLMLFVLVMVAGAAFYYFSTKGTRDKSAAIEAAKQAEEVPVLEETPADSSAMADTITVH